ncbi:Adenine DNA glycosylase [Pseudomonas syringae pv. actinidiae]|uniref:Adenine DNA glycosylase n=6 Tax=Pseudomonas syringae group TaxID=136849 RepID=A0A2V0QNL0_PSESF|nr:Adenine DNA glycosylase [Pseudomonas syringae pv. actinidiae]OSN21250.1 Adenine DNA glycosylase [Pseudomonas syringae pv. actinidiae]OSN22189.1 Adenine DNA glycosylase [Pseudomonas syringae pv. actinidiae]OSN31754.1 Adenine DNA glycosylase [Pseudomonas syringae pv. actinidiae]OSN34952.1 Adenine DNA glycosylase [Pseudomonas syringae pv. actinidiae]
MALLHWQKTFHIPTMRAHPAMQPEQFSSAVLDWYDRHGRHDLPWQQGITPYRVWVSEIMLQQTQVSTVLNYFDRFMEALPTVQALAEAPEDEVLHLWTGLGYYTRARNLQKTAKIVVADHDGEFPRDVEKLILLPGIGLSTAGAIASLSMGLRAPILDGNVKRVLARFTAQEGYPGEPKVAKQLWATAERFTPHSRVNNYTQAMMDLGATLCTRSKPSCLLCPLERACQAHMLGLETRYPIPKPRKTVPQKRTLMPMLANEDGAILLYRRPSSGLWGGLWSLPELDDFDDLQHLATQHALQLGEHHELPGLVHTFSHFQLSIEPWLVKVQESADHVAEADWLWYNLATPPRLGLAAPVKKLLKRAADVLNAGESS